MYGGWEYTVPNPESGSRPGPVTRSAAYQTFPQSLADDMALECQAAIEWFHDPVHVFLGVADLPRKISDSEVRERVAGYQLELDAEAMRVSVTGDSMPGRAENAYQLADLPFTRQRALVERWERLWNRWFEVHPGWICTDEGFIPPPENPHNIAEGH